MADGHENGHSHGDNAQYYSMRAQAMQAILIEKGVCTLDDIMTMADKIDSRSPEDGAKILAHAWVDPEYKKRLLADAESAFLGERNREPGLRHGIHRSGQQRNAQLDFACQ